MQTLTNVGAAIINLIVLGGPVVAILLCMSVIALTIVIVKLWQFSRMRIRDRNTARGALNIYESGNVEAAVGMAQRTPNPAAQVLARAIENRERRLPEAKIREELLRMGGDMLESLRSWFRALEVIASLAPLLGLFGTVLGMIEAFQDLQQAGSQVDPAVLSSGIWQALLTTAVGLAVAMPVTVVLNWFERRIDRLAHDMDSMVTRVFTVEIGDKTSMQQDVPAHEPRRTPHI